MNTIQITKEKPKMVKNSHLVHENDIIRIIHYDTFIFEYDVLMRRCKVLMDCSRTSNRMIKRALDFYEIPQEQIIKLENSSKWGFSS